MEWRTRFNQNVLNRAEDYIQSSPVQDLRIEENHVTARVIDIEDYDVGYPAEQRHSIFHEVQLSVCNSRR